MWKNNLYSGGMLHLLLPFQIFHIALKKKCFTILRKPWIPLFFESLDYFSFMYSPYSEAREREKEDQAEKEFRSPCTDSSASASSATGAGSTVTQRYLDMVGDSV